MIKVLYLQQNANRIECDITEELTRLWSAITSLAYDESGWIWHLRSSTSQGWSTTWRWMIWTRHIVGFVARKRKQPAPPRRCTILTVPPVLHQLAGAAPADPVRSASGPRRRTPAATLGPGRRSASPARDCPHASDRASPSAACGAEVAVSIHGQGLGGWRSTGGRKKGKSGWSGTNWLENPRNAHLQLC